MLHELCTVMLLERRDAEGCHLLGKVPEEREVVGKGANRILGFRDWGQRGSDRLVSMLSAV